MSEVNQPDAQGSDEQGEIDKEELVRAIEGNEEELAALLELAPVIQGLSADLAPELQTAVRENRADIEQIRLAFENEDMLVLLQRVGDNAEELTNLLELLAVVDHLAQDLSPELRTAVQENRDALERVRFALEREETLELLEQVGKNAETLSELLALTTAAHELGSDVVPELTDAAHENRQPIRDLRMVIAGATETYSTGAEITPHELGKNLGNMLRLGQQLGNPQLITSVEAGLGAFTEKEPPKRVGLLGLLGALRDSDVRQGLGVLVEFLRRMGATRAN